MGQVLSEDYEKDMTLADVLNEESKKEEIKKEIANFVSVIISKYFEEYVDKKIISGFEKNIESQYMIFNKSIFKTKKKKSSDRELIDHLNVLKFLVDNHDISEQTQKYLIQVILQDYLTAEIDKSIMPAFKSKKSEENLCLNQVYQQSLTKMSLMKTMQKKKKIMNRFQMN